MPKAVTEMTVKILWRRRCLLGESPVWSEEEQCLYFVDIKQRKLYRWNSAENVIEFTLSQETGSIAITSDGGIIAAQTDGFAYISLSPFKEFPINFPYTEPPGTRFNDGKCDCYGRFWAASMDDACKNPIGSIWSLSPNGSIERHDTGFIVGNGFGWNKENKIMYFTDSENRQILKYDFDLETGKLSNRSVFVKLSDNEGFPDGLVIDEDDYIWSAQWDGSKIIRYNPHGKVDQIIKLPIPRPTSLVFGGRDMKTLFITSASIGLDEKEMEEAPLSGSLFALSTNIKGCILPLFGKKT